MMFFYLCELGKLSIAGVLSVFIKKPIVTIDLIDNKFHRKAAQYLALFTV
jgi:hypothetical protein